MKTFAILILVMSISYSNGMELLASLIPSKKLTPQSSMSPRKKARPSPVGEYPKVVVTQDMSAPITHLQPAVYTPTSTKVRVNLLKAMTEAIYGPQVSQPFIEDLKNDPERLQASPNTFGKRCRSTFRALLFDDLEQMGVNEQDVKNQLIPARKSLEKEAADLKKLPASSKEVKAIGKSLAKEVGCQNLVFRKSTTPDDYAYITGNVLVLNEDEVEPAHLTEQELSWLMAHEIEHYVNNDLVESEAHKLAFKKHIDELKSRLSKAPGDKKIAETLKAFRAASSKFKGRELRTDEVFADVGPALRRPDLARGYEKTMKRWIETREEDSGEEGIQTHPTHEMRLKLAQATRDFHQQHAKEQSRMAAVPLMLKSARRSLVAEFEQSEQEG